MDSNILYLIKLIQCNPELFCAEILKYPDDKILICLTYLFFSNKEIFDLIITYIGQNENTYHILQIFLRILRNNNMELFKYILLMNIPYILNHYINFNFKNIKYLLNNLLFYDILLLNSIKFIKYENNLKKFIKILDSNKELKEYKYIINKILIKHNINIKLHNIEKGKELFFYESIKKNHILEITEFKNLLKKEKTIFANGNHLIILDKNCENKYKNIFLLDDIISNTNFLDKKIIDIYNLVIILSKEDYKNMFPLYIDNKINVIKFKNILFMGLLEEDIEKFMENIELNFCKDQDIILSKNDNVDIENSKNGNINILKIQKIDQLLNYFKNYKNLKINNNMGEDNVDI